MKKTILILTIIFTFATFTKAEEERIRPTVHLNKAVPKFSGVSLSGRTWTNDSLKGKVTLIAFWAIGCGPCMYEINYLNNLNLKYKDKDFQLISIAAKYADDIIAFNDTNNNQFSKFRKSLNVEPINYEIIPTCKDTSMNRIVNLSEGINLMECQETCKDFNVLGFPVLFICDKNGVVRDVTEGFTLDSEEAKTIFNEINAIIEKLLKE